MALIQMSSKPIGNRLLSVRNAAGLNQREFAERLATSSGYISGVESGKTMPGGDFLLRLHAEFKTDVAWLLTGQHSLDPKAAWLRLKAEMKADKDQAVAGWLGMTIAEINGYTLRSEFPVPQFLAACKASPGQVDMGYVLDGVPQAAREMIAAVREGTPYAKLAKRERELLDAWRRCTPEDQDVLLVMAKRLVGRK